MNVYTLYFGDIVWNCALYMLQIVQFKQSSSTVTVFMTCG